MMNKLRIRFTVIAMAATVIVTTALILAINIANNAQTDRTLKAALAEIEASQKPGVSQWQNIQGLSGDDSENRIGRENSIGQESETGKETETGKENTFREEGNAGNGKKNGKKNGRHSALVQYSGRFFRVLAADSGEIRLDGWNQEMISEENLKEMVERILEKGSETGYAEDFLYHRSEYPESGQTLISFLDCTTDQQAKRELMLISLITGIIGCLVSFFFIFLMSGKIILPLKISMEKQKQFITDASHELKTPLSVIGTNMDILSMDLGENEWVDGSKKQVKKLRKLVSHLVSLSRMDEAETVLALRPFCISSAVAECADLYRVLAESEGKELQARAEDSLTVTGDETSIRQLVTILCDNAIKYSLEGSVIQLRLYRENSRTYFETENAWNRTLPPDQFDRLFDRFFRADTARTQNGKKDSFGLGLSIARAIAEKNNIQLQAFENQEGRLVFQVVFRR